jgi:hypothetical protein
MEMEVFGGSTLKVYFEPVEGSFNELCLETATITDVSTPNIVDEYMERFSEAWEELSKK